MCEHYNSCADQRERERQRESCVPAKSSMGHSIMCSCKIRYGTQGLVKWTVNLILGGEGFTFLAAWMDDHIHPSVEVDPVKWGTTWVSCHRSNGYSVKSMGCRVCDSCGNTNCVVTENSTKKMHYSLRAASYTLDYNERYIEDNQTTVMT